MKWITTLVAYQAHLVWIESRLEWVESHWVWIQSKSNLMKLSFVYCVFKIHTRMHSSMTRYGRLLPVSPKLHCAGGWSAPRGCLLPGGLLGGVCSLGEGSLLLGGEGCLLLGGVCFQHSMGQPACEQNSWHTLLKYYLVPTSLRSVKILGKNPASNQKTAIWAINKLPIYFC